MSAQGSAVVNLRGSIARAVKAGQPAEAALGAHFELVEGDQRRADGVYWIALDGEGKTLPPAWICSPLRVKACVSNGIGTDWGRLVEFSDLRGKVHFWCCPQEMQSGNGEELRAVLLREGLRIASSPKLRAKVGEYIQRAEPGHFARCVDRTGWHGDVFVLPRETIGTADEPVLLQSAAPSAVPLSQSGTLESWRDNVCARCAQNSRLVLAVSIAFAAPCLGLVQGESGGIHYRGPSSAGKTTAAHVAASAYGAPESYVESWRATDNALEGTACQHSDMLLVLDEIDQIDPRHAGQTAYMLANGQAKGRSYRDGTPRPISRWRTLFLSTGEVGMADKIAESGNQVRAGQQVRVIDVPADTGAFGLFECVPAGLTPAGFSDALKDAAREHHGTAFPAFVRAMVENPARARQTLRALRDGITAELAAAGAAGQVRRVADRIALVAAAGELATLYGLTGWPTGEAQRAAVACFNAWLAARGTDGNAEKLAMLTQVRAFLEANAEARFTAWDADTSRIRTINRAGYRRDTDTGSVYYIQPEVFRREVCRGFDVHAVLDVLDKAGALDHEPKRMDKKPRLPDGSTRRVFVVTSAVWGRQGERE